MQFNINFIGINDKIINLDQVAMIENESDEIETKAVVLFADGAEIELTGEDADLLFHRVEMIMDATDTAIAALQQVAAQATQQPV